MLKAILFFCVVGSSLDPSECWITDINMNMLAMTLKDFDEDPTSEELDRNITAIATSSTLPKKVQISVPGTYWCGSGVRPDDDTKLGTDAKTDKCCRTHKKCSSFIEGGAKKHGIRNVSFFKRYSCECDDDFLRCLKNADTQVADILGGLYFNLLSTLCYRKDYPVIGCLRHEGWFGMKCGEYSYDKSREKIYQWFDVKSYYLEEAKKIIINFHFKLDPILGWSIPTSSNSSKFYF